MESNQNSAYYSRWTQLLPTGWTKLLATKLLATTSWHRLYGLLLFVAVVAIIAIIIVVVVILRRYVAQLLSHALSAGHAKSLATSTRGLVLFFVVVGRVGLVGRIVVGTAAFNVGLWY